MEKHIETLLTVLMDKVEHGVPDGKGGYYEQPVASDAKSFILESGGELDAAVAAAAHDIFVRKGHWSGTVKRGVMLALVGAVPFVGSTAAVFYEQFESLWTQLRFVSLAATIYGHDIKDDATQCQIILCLLDDKIRQNNGASAMEKIYSKGVKSGIQVAATIIARQIVTRGGRSFFYKSVLGGLLSGVVPEAVAVLYAFIWDGDKKTEAQVALKVKELLTRVKEHFKREEKPSPLIAMVAFVVWFLPVVVMNGIRVGRIFDKFLVRLYHLIPIRLVMAEYNDNVIVQVINYICFQLLTESMRDYIMMIFLLCIKGTILCMTLYVVVLFTLFVSRKHTWLVSTTVLGIRAFLNFISARNTAVSIALSVFSMSYSTDTTWVYHSHRAAVGLFMILKRFRKELNPQTPFVVGSLLVWILFYIATTFIAYCKVFVPLLYAANFSSFSEAYSGIKHASPSFASTRFNDALGATSTIALHILIEELRRKDLIMVIAGPKKAIEGILFAAKSLGHVVTSPDMVLFWLDKTTPPLLVSWALLSAQYCATGLGLGGGFLKELDVISTKELVLVCYGVLFTVPFYLWQTRLPPPYDEQVWEEALKSRHRLLYLIPDLDSGFRSKLYYAIRFFENYEFVKARSHEYATTQFGTVKEWVAHFFIKENDFKPEDEEDLIDIDALKYDPRDEISWFASWFGRSNTVEDTIENEIVDPTKEDSKNENASKDENTNIVTAEELPQDDNLSNGSSMSENSQNFDIEGEEGEDNTNNTPPETGQVVENKRWLGSWRSNNVPAAKVVVTEDDAKLETNQVVGEEKEMDINVNEIVEQENGWFASWRKKQINKNDGDEENENADNRWFASWRKQEHTNNAAENNVEDNRWFASWRNPKIDVGEVEQQDDASSPASDKLDADNRWFASWRGPPADKQQAILEESQTNIEESQAIVEESQTNIEKSQTNIEESQTNIEESQTIVDEPQTNVDEQQTIIEQQVENMDEQQKQDEHGKDNRWFASWRSPLNEDGGNLTENQLKGEEEKKHVENTFEDNSSTLKKWFNWSGNNNEEGEAKDEIEKEKEKVE